MNEENTKRMTTLFLDFDGVLHPDAAYLKYDSKEGRSIILKAEGHALFEHAELLAEILEPHKNIEIVLSTSWVHVFSLAKAKEYLPRSLQEKIIGSTWHRSIPKKWWESMTRFKQIEIYVQRNQLTDWIAIDDNNIGWPDEQRHHLILCEKYCGIGDAEPQAKLASWLDEIKMKDKS